MRHFFVITSLLFFGYTYSQKKIRLDSLIYSFMNNTISCKEKCRLYFIHDTLIFNSLANSNLEGKLVKSKSSMVSKKRKGKVCVAQLANFEYSNKGNEIHLEIGYVLDRFIKVNKGNTIWRNEGIYRFYVIQEQASREVLKVEFINGINPVIIYSK